MHIIAPHWLAVILTGWLRVFEFLFSASAWHGGFWAFYKPVLFILQDTGHNFNFSYSYSCLQIESEIISQNFFEIKLLLLVQVVDKGCHQHWIKRYSS